MAAASGDFQLRPETRSRTDKSVLSAIALGMVAKRPASSQGSTFIRASAERTLSRIPFASSHTGANRKSSYLALSVENLARWSIGVIFLQVREERSADNLYGASSVEF